MYYILGILVMAFVTYVPRVLPLSLVRRPIRNRFFRSWLYYMPYAVLGAMTFPALLYSTSSIWSAVAGMAAALVLAYVGLSLMPVAVISTGVVLVVEGLLHIYF